MHKEVLRGVYSIQACLVFLSSLSLSVVSDDAKADQSSPLIFKGCSIIRRAFMSEAAAAYEKQTGHKIIVSGGGATMGIRAAAASTADIGGSCRPILPGRFKQEQGVQMVVVAWDALVFITHPANTIDNITLQQAKDVLLGKITNWKTLGGPDKPIVAILRSQVPGHGGKISGVGYMTRRLLFDDPDINFISKALFFRHSSEVEQNIESIPYAFGVTGVSSANKRRLKILKLDGVEPSKTNIANATYPLFRPLYLIIEDKPSSEVQGFIDWLLSDEGQQVVSAQGTVNLEEGQALSAKYKLWQHRALIKNVAP